MFEWVCVALLEFKSLPGLDEGIFESYVHLNIVVLELTDGAVMFANLRKCVKWVKYEKINWGEEIWTLVYGVGAHSSANFQYMDIWKKDKTWVVISRRFFWKGYLPNLLETALCHQILVFWARDPKFWLQLRFFKPVKSAGSDFT